MFRLIKRIKFPISNLRRCSNLKENVSQPENTEFETVFTFPSIKYIAILNRMKVYHVLGTSIAIPGCGLLELMNVLPYGCVFTATYIGLTGTALLSLATLPFKNVIGFIYISEDNEKVKISFLDYWGRRKDRIISVDDWIPLLDLGTKRMDPVYLTPQLSDGTKYKLFIKFSKVLNPSKIGQVLE